MGSHRVGHNRNDLAAEEKETVTILNLVARDFIEKESLELRPVGDKPCNPGEVSPSQSQEQTERPELRPCLRCLRNSKVSMA